MPKLNALIYWEIFRHTLNRVPKKEHCKERLSNAGRKPYDVVLMFKILMDNYRFSNATRLLITADAGGRPLLRRFALSFGRYGREDAAHRIRLIIRLDSPNNNTLLHFRQFRKYR